MWAPAIVVVSLTLGLLFGSVIYPGLISPLILTPGAASSTGGAPPTDPPVGGGGSNATPAGTSCGSDSTPTPSSVLIPISGPNETLQAGGTLTATFEVGVASESGRPSGTTIFMPSTFANFPLASGETAQLYVGPHNFVLAGTGWGNASSWSKSVTESGGLTFVNPSSAVLTTEKLAVTANASYGAVLLEVRWDWSLLQPNGSSSVGSWSVPTEAAHWPTTTPSEFDPAPYVSLVSTNGPTETIGENFTASLGGMVASRYFFLELEASNTGKVAQNHGETAAVGASSTVVTIQLLNYDRYLYPGSYLVHVHDGCGALLLSLSITAVYAANANVTVQLQPSSCGKVTLDGTAYSSGSVASIAPSSTPYSFGVPSCSGHAFSGWSFTGGVYLYSSSQLLISSNGSLAVEYS